MYTRRMILKSAGLGAAAMCLSPLETVLAAQEKQKDKGRYNVVFILADDLGFKDTSAYGSKFLKTPNIDRLARKGMLFTQAYAASPLCSPTRSSIMTGMWPARIGFTRPHGHYPEEIFVQTIEPKSKPFQKCLQPVSVTRLKNEYFTLAEAFKENGYATAHFGKWHLGREPYDPLHQGFDIDLPHTYAEGPRGGYLGPWDFWEGEGKPGEHIEDHMAKEAVKFIKENKDKPFLLNYWCFSVHNPWNAKPELIKKFAQKADPNDPQHNPVYGAMVESMDDAIGTLLDTIESQGLADKTIIIFNSDNGGFDTPGTRGELDSYDLYKDIPVTSNLPLREGKCSIYEGGTREPLIMVWPGKIKPGSRNEDALVQSIDFYPTLVEMCGLKLSQRPAFDGISITPAFDGRGIGRDSIFCHFPHYGRPEPKYIPASYVRKGDWKLIRFYFDGPDFADRFELFNLKDDIGEQHDLAEKNPAKVQELKALLEKYLNDSKAVLPIRNPNYKPQIQGNCRLS